MPEEGGQVDARRPLKIYVYQLTLSLSEGVDYAPHITTPPKILRPSDIPVDFAFECKPNGEHNVKIGK